MVHERRASLFAVALALGASSTTGAAEFVTPLAGGTGGDLSYNLNCGADGVLVGLSGRWGGWLDSIGIICRKVNADGTLGSAFTLGPKGGNGGSTAGNPTCNAANVVQSVHAFTGMYVNRAAFGCGAWSPATRRVAQAVFTPGAAGSDVDGVGPPATQDRSVLDCPTDGKPAKGIRGKHGSFIDSIALVCDSVAAVAAGASGKAGGLAGGSGAVPVASGASSVIQFDVAPAAGAIVALSTSRGGDVVIRASGGTAALSMALSVTDGTYRPFFELVSGPAPTPAPAPGTTVKPLTTPSIGTQASPQTASITRVVRMRPGAPFIAGFSPPAITLVVTVQNANGAASARAFAVRLSP